MKLVTSFLIFATASVSNAAVLCTVTRENPQIADQYDQIVFNDWVDKEVALTLKSDGSVITTRTFESIFDADRKAVENVPEAKTKFDEIYRGARFIFISSGEGDVVTISFAHFDGDSTGNQLPPETHWSGSVERHPVWALNALARVSVACAKAPAPAAGTDAKP